MYVRWMVFLSQYEWVSKNAIPALELWCSAVMEHNPFCQRDYTVLSPAKQFALLHILLMMIYKICSCCLILATGQIVEEAAGFHFKVILNFCVCFFPPSSRFYQCVFGDRMMRQVSHFHPIITFSKSFLLARTATWSLQQNTLFLNKRISKYFHPLIRDFI